ncbi:MAG: tetratricopeptide repeat protein [Isosphaeraceae bacterium]
MELVRGIPITEYCDREQLSIPERLELFVLVCRAVQHAHQKGVIHRDLKPSNILVTVIDGAAVPKVIDFGVAKATGAALTERTIYTAFQQFVGTPLYMSPEQADLAGVDVDTRSDIYSLGVLLYELLTGTTPFDRETFRKAAFDELRRMIREEEPPRPSTRLSSLGATRTTISANRKADARHLDRTVRGELDWVVMKALEKDRRRRYETASDFAADVMRYLTDQPVQACPPSAAYRLRKFARRNKSALTVAWLVLLFLIVLGAVGGWVVRDRAVRREETARQARESLTRARQWSGENKLALAREELAATRVRLGGERTALRGLAAEVEALDAELSRLQHFLALIEQAHEAEFPLPVALALQAGSADGTTAPARASDASREPGKAVPFLLRALSRYGVMERDDWSARLEDGLLEQDVVAQVRRTAYEQLLWLADDAVRRQADHRSGSQVSRRQAADQGLAYLRQAEAAAPATSAFYLVRARCLKALGKPAEARPYEELARQTPGTVALDRYLLALAAQSARDKTEAVKQYEAALHVEPAHYWSLQGLGSCLIELGQQEQDFAVAAAVFTGCILKRPDHARSYLGRGYAYSKLGRLKDAEAEYREALRLRPDYAEACANLGWVLREQGKADQAIAAYREAIRLQPDMGCAYNNLGTMLQKQEKVDEAIAAYREAVRLGPANHADHHGNLGNALSRRGKWDEAIAEHREAIRLGPAHANNHNGLAWSLANCPDPRFRDPTQAVDLARRAVELAPRNGTYRNTLGVALYRAGDWQAAVAALEKSMELGNGGDALDCWFLAMARWQLGRQDEARSWYDKALAWMETHQPKDEELLRFRAEAAALMGIDPHRSETKPPAERARPPG